MIATAYNEFESGNKTGTQVRNELVGTINNVLKEVLDVRISSLGNVSQGKGQLYFEKDDSKNFPYQNLSAGEKEVIDIVIDLIVRSTEYDDTVYCIDEPELHLNTAIQRRLLVQIEKLIPENCQLWVATHSIGFLRALQEELAGRCSVLDFSTGDLFRGVHVLSPMEPTRANWQRIFSTALDDLAGLIAPKRIVYCEGRPDPNATGSEQGVDAIVYNEIFGRSEPQTLFISAGGSGQLPKHNSIALLILQKAFVGAELILLRDRDSKSDAERQEFLADAPHHRMLQRHEIENYLLDYDVLGRFCSASGNTLDKATYDALVGDITKEDLKQGKMNSLKQLAKCGTLSDNEFLKRLAPFVSGSSVFEELRQSIF
ncbi:MAG: AAA family ATPase [Alphaproteobacteria bacterium]